MRVDGRRLVVGGVLSALVTRRLSLCFSSSLCILLFMSVSHMYTSHGNAAAIKSSACVTHMYNLRFCLLPGRFHGRTLCLRRCHLSRSPALARGHIHTLANENGTVLGSCVLSSPSPFTLSEDCVSPFRLALSVFLFACSGVAVTCVCVAGGSHCA